MNNLNKEEEQQMAVGQPTSTTNDSSNGSESKETYSNKVTCEAIEGTPFLLIENNENYFLAIGKYRMEDYFTTKEEAIEKAKKIDWDNICFFMSTLRTEMFNLIKTLKNNEN